SRSNQDLAIRENGAARITETAVFSVAGGAGINQIRRDGNKGPTVVCRIKHFDDVSPIAIFTAGYEESAILNHLRRAVTMRVTHWGCIGPSAIVIAAM